ncbi:ArsC family reductase [Mesorhizobium sp. BR1-1-16]|uniref:ArsC family reductase n=1 Tax=Mesorhizobium sp. BR1-1-16 TaxID=2876653 RepID=UPI001CCB12DC|nr:ArsC family reductase [Mesorhizobium sp. BR1-1-16]MBZ9937848.1 ArsC family reductase [Mesorhizobium sp. BR1-1-16]
MTDASIALWGIKNCDTMKKARLWLDQNGVAYTFRDYKQEGVDPRRLAHWIATLGWEVVLNRAGTTFRALPDSAKANLDAERAAALMLAQPSMIKRPMLDRSDGLLLAGFKSEIYAKALLGSKD